MVVVPDESVLEQKDDGNCFTTNSLLMTITDTASDNEIHTFSRRLLLLVLYVFVPLLGWILLVSTIVGRISSKIYSTTSVLSCRENDKVKVLTKHLHNNNNNNNISARLSSHQFQSKFFNHNNNATSSLPSIGTTIVPFVALTIPDWKLLSKQLDRFQDETRRALQQLSYALDVTLQSENTVTTTVTKCWDQQRWCYSNHLHNKIQQLSIIYDSDCNTWNRILIPFEIQLMLPDAEIPNNSESMYNPTTTTTTPTQSANGQEQRYGLYGTHGTDHQPYNTLYQVSAHIIRDWSSVGAPIRASLYTWCVHQFHKYGWISSSNNNNSTKKKKEPILVPGAGLGRLAWELSTQLQHPVEAIESSLCMTAAAYTILHGHTFQIHPYAMDPFTNEIDSSKRYDNVLIPDIDPTVLTVNQNQMLSYTFGDFNSEYMHNHRSFYSAIVTCYFLDTATTVYDYLMTIEGILIQNGLWVNVGPLQWHSNNQVPMAVDEIRMILEQRCNPYTGKPIFQILFWEIDAQPINYREDQQQHRSTRFDAYMPLRFVIRKIN